MLNPDTAVAEIPADTERLHAGSRPFGCRMLWSLRENALLIAITFIYCLASFIVRDVYRIAASPLDNILATCLGIFASIAIGAFLVFALWFLYLKRIKKQADLLSFVGRQLKENYLTLDRLMLAAPFVLLWPLFVSSFSYLKALIPIFQPFRWDATLAHWDRVLHFGRLPSDWLAPLLNHLLPTFIINWSYTMWFIVIMVVLFLQVANTGNRQLRAQYLLTQALLWPLLGNLAAIFFSSAGPCYFGLLNAGPNPYAAHMSALQEITSRLTFPLFGHTIQLPTAVLLQQFLWDGYQTSRLTIGEGISACPSLHVASSC